MHFCTTLFEPMRTNDKKSVSQSVRRLNPEVYGQDTNAPLVNPPVGYPGHWVTPPRRETDLHNQILTLCRENGWIAFHGSTAHRTYRTKGEPDFTVLLPGGRLLLVECKRPGGKLRVEQQALKLWAERLGHTVHVVTSLNELKSLANEQLT